METVACAGCNWRFFKQPGREEDLCPNCRKYRLESIHEEKDLSVELLVPYSLTAEEFKTRVTAFSREIPFSPADLSPEKVLSRVEEIFLPRYLVDAKVKASWRADMGFNYEVVSHEEVYQSTEWKTVERRETREKLEPRLGRLERIYENVPAASLEDETQLRIQVGNFSIQNAEPINNRTIDSWIRIPDRSFDDSWSDAVLEFKRRATEDCRDASDADNVNGFGWDPTFEESNLTLLLLPIYTSYYLDDNEEIRRIVVNGQSGALYGERRSSEVKAKKLAFGLLISAAVCLAVSLGLGVLSFFVPVAGVAALVMFLIGAGCGIGAGFSVFTARRFNKKETTNQ